MPFIVDDVAIAAAIAAAEEAAAAAAASGAGAAAAEAGSAAGAGAAGAGAAGAGAEAATTDAIASAAAQQAAASQAVNSSVAASQAANSGAQATMADSLAQTANAAQTQLMPGTQASLGAPIDVTPPPVAPGPVAAPPPGGSMPAGSQAPQSFTDKLSSYAGKIGDTLTSPEFLAPLALQGIGSAMSYGGIDKGSDYVNDTLQLTKDVTKGEQAKSNKAVTDWGSNYLSPESIQRNTDEAYAKLAGDYVANQDRAKKDLGGVVGNVPDEYAKAMSSAATNSSQEAADYAKKLAKAQAPAFADLRANIGEMQANRTSADAMSDMRQAGAAGYNALGYVPGDNSMLTGAALRGLGSGLATVLGK